MRKRRSTKIFKSLVNRRVTCSALLRFGCITLFAVMSFIMCTSATRILVCVTWKKKRKANTHTPRERERPRSIPRKLRRKTRKWNKWNPPRAEDVYARVCEKAREIWWKKSTIKLIRQFQSMYRNVSARYLNVCANVSKQTLPSRAYWHWKLWYRKRMDGQKHTQAHK